MSKFELGSTSLAHIVLTFSCAFLLCILFESPIHGLEKIALKRERPTRNKTEIRPSAAQDINTVA